MFRAALVRLTLLYLLIIMAISVFFSIIIYNVSAIEIANNAGRQQNVITKLGRGDTMMDDPALLAERQRLVDTANQNILDNLLYTNIVILVLGGGLCYYLAGRTLNPIEEAHESQSRFTGDASHELRSPLAAMKAEIEVALRDPGLTKEDAIALLVSNLEEVERLRTLSDGLLELSRDNGQGIEKSDFDLTKAVKQGISKIQDDAKTKNITIEQHLTENIKLRASKSQTEELLLIVLDNAVKYSPEGSNISIETATKGRNSIIKVRDEGVGISDENLPKIFDRFYRAEQSRTKNTTPGYGLGLALAKKITTANGGSIAVESKLGEGSTFIIRLPLT